MTNLELKNKSGRRCTQRHADRKRRFYPRSSARVSVRVLLTVCLLAFSAPSAYAQTQTPGPQYVVQPGDSLYSIALAFGTTVDALQQANGIADPSLLSVGQTLTIPGFDGVTGTLTIHEMAAGETLDGFAKRVGASRDTLIRLNRITNPALLYVGQSLIYPEGNTGLAAGTTESAQKGESIPALAAQSGQTVWGLALLNDLDSPYKLYAGQYIILPADPAQGPALTGLPEPFSALTLNPGHPVHGGTLEIVAKTAEGTTLSGEFGSWPLRFASDPVGQVALQGINALADPGLYPLVITATTPGGESITFERMIPVAPAAGGDYPYQQLVVGADQSALLDPNVVGPERDQVAQLASPYSATRQWQGMFIKPVDSDRVTTGFGWRRSYNGGPYDSFHGGIDYGAPGGSPIVAPAAGTVVFAGPLTVRGNATLIDHGWGVYTAYWHQSKINVSVGQTVQAGEVIGEVGSTGLSTGSHLHFEMWVGGNQVNPEQWLTTEFP